MACNQQQDASLKNHLENEFKELEDIEIINRWEYENIVGASDRELAAEAERHGLKDDPQTREFCEFISAATAFSSMDLKDKIAKVPELVNITKELIEAILKEIKEFSDIALDFREIINFFVRLVIETQRNLLKLLPHLENSITFLEMYIDAQQPGLNGTLSEVDKNDINTALENLVDGVENVKAFVKTFECESDKADNRIKVLKDKVIGKIEIVNNRMTFQQLLSPAGAVLGGTLGVGAAQMAIESSILGGIGALVIGGVTFPPMGAIVLAAVLGSLGVGTMFYVVKRLWESHQYKAIGFLKEILKKLDELSLANTEFVKLMNKSSVHASRLHINIVQLRKISFDPSTRSRKANIAICGRSIESTKQIIETMNQVNKFDLSSWIAREEISFHDAKMTNNIKLPLQMQENKETKAERFKKFFRKTSK